MAPARRERRRPGLRRLALLCAASLSCTTIRTPISTIEPAVTVYEGRAEPQLELWVESNRPLTRADTERYRREAQAALEKALAGRTQPEDGDELLVIRAQGVTRTRGHRNDQVAATTGIVVGAVVIVAAAAIAFAAGGKGHGGGGGPRPARTTASPSAPRLGGGMPGPGLAAAPLAPGPRIPAPRFPATPAPRVPLAHGFPLAPAPRGLPAAPAPRTPTVPMPGPIPREPSTPAMPVPVANGAPGPAVNVEVGLSWNVHDPEPPEPMAFEPPPQPAPLFPDLEPEAGEAPPEIAAEYDQLPLPAPSRYPVDDRGFFDGDRLVLEAVVVDRASREALWVKRVSRKADPRDARAVKEAVDALLSDKGWRAPSAE